MAIEKYSQASNILLQAVKQLCRPLIKLLISKGISYPQLREMLKALYVEIAEQNFAINNKPVTDSRLFVLTGVHRKDIKRLRQENKQGGQKNEPIITLSAAIIGYWLGSAEYQDKLGKPRCLPRNDKNGKPGFDHMITQVSKDVRPRAILDELLHLGTVSINEDAEICLNHGAFVPEDDNKQAYYLAHNVHDHLAACAHNMQKLDEPMLERSVYYTSLKQSSIDQLNELALSEGMIVLHKVNQRALQLQQQDKGLPDASHRMRFGCYWFDEDTKTDEGATS